MKDVRHEIDALRAEMGKKGKRRANKSDGPEVSFAQQRYTLLQSRHRRNRLVNDSTHWKVLCSRYGAMYSRREQRQELRALCKEASQRERAVVADVLRRANVVLATCVGAGSRLLREAEFDLVVIDEAAQGLEAACWIPILKMREGGGRCVLAGGFSMWWCMSGVWVGQLRYSTTPNPARCDVQVTTASSRRPSRARPPRRAVWESRCSNASSRIPDSARWCACWTRSTA